MGIPLAVDGASAVSLLGVPSVITTRQGFEEGLPCR